MLQRGHTMLCVVVYFAKSLKVIHNFEAISILDNYLIN